MGDGAQRHFGDLAGDLYGTPGSRAPVVFLHGLGYDRRQWGPVLRELAVVDPERRVLVLDLPGHGESFVRDSYHSREIAESVHRAVTEAGLEAPVLVGHSLGGLLATVYAAMFPVRGVVNVDQPLLPGNFGAVLRGAESVLRGPGYGQIWESLSAEMGIDLLPSAVRELARTPTPRQDLLLGYWHELLVTPAAELSVSRTRALDAIRTRATPYQCVGGEPLVPAYRSWLERVLPQLSVTVLPGGGHFPHLARPAEFAEILAA